MKLLSGCRSLFLITCSALGFGASFAQVPALEINTANAQLTDNIRAHVRLPSISCASDDVELARALRSRVATLTNTVERASQAVGFYSAEPQITLEKTADCWLLSIAVEAGDPVLIKSVAISIDADADLFASTLENLPLREGSQLSHGDYEAAKAELTARAFELGYLDARFTLARLTIDKPQLAASIELALDLGARHRFGQIAFDTGGALSNDFVNRFVTFNEGDFYSPQKLLDLRSALNDSQYFADISITPRLGETSNLVPIDLVMTSRPRRVYEYGAGITTDTGPRLSGYYEDRFRNPEGHRVNATTSLSPI